MSARTSQAVVGRTLQAALVDLIDLALAGKQAHWNVRGPSFRSVHLQLDEVIIDLRLHADDVAERMAALEFAPDGRTGTVAEQSKVADIGGGVLSDDAVVTAFAGQLTATSERISAHLPELEGDLASQDLLIGIVASLDKHAWMFRVQHG